ncbi:MAG: TetR/AcrR family transcriptional regulator [Mycoplasma sp.]|nr:TetR/AcrR family transcriptional regulator [Candidatus Hennigella equi]
MKYSYEELDERIVKTRIALTGAIFEIIKENINVKVLDICKKANITPMTYYHHFDNKKHLLEFAVRSQLQNILPIPRKLKPENMRQLVAYLLKSFLTFAKQNKEIIKASIVKLESKGWENSYIRVLLSTIEYYVYFEIRRLQHNMDEMTIQIWTDTIVNVLFITMLKRINNIESYEFNLMWNCLKALWNNL